jgi:hypothetical protein
MRRAALRVACVVVGTAVAVAMAASGSAVKPPPAPNGPTPLVLTATNEGRVVLLTSPRGMWDFYGHVTSSNNEEGSYRALCAALEAPPPPGPHPAFTGQARASTDIGDRLTCTIVVLFENDNASLVMEGIVTKPTGSELFAALSDRVLALTGGTGATTYQGSIGVAQPTGNHQVSIFYW